MLFQSPEFLYFLMSILVLIALIRTNTLQLIVLLVGSYIFYVTFKPAYILLILFCTINNYFAGLRIGSTDKRRVKLYWLLQSCITNVGLLCYFKYYNFFITTIHKALIHYPGTSLLPILDISLPVGISFYTFQSLGYVIDVFRKENKPEKSLIKFALFVAFFPVVLSGPILRSTSFFPQLCGIINLDSKNIRSGFNLFLVGLVKKVLIADQIAPLVNAILTTPQGLPSSAIVIGGLTFGIQIYCDFSGYTDMARGVGKMLGFELPINFQYPYLSTSFYEFWRRWHISLSTWLRDYVYIPLGGNRKGSIRTYYNLIVTMGLCGLWHGASWNFIIWGLYHGILLAIERKVLQGSAKSKVEMIMLSQSGGTKQRNLFHQFLILFRWLIIQYFVFLGWVIFRVNDINDILYCVRKYILFDLNFSVRGLGLGNANIFLIMIILLIFLVFHSISYRINGIALLLDRMQWQKRLIAYIIIIFALIQLWPAENTSFIYFQF